MRGINITTLPIFIGPTHTLRTPITRTPHIRIIGRITAFRTTAFHATAMDIIGLIRITTVIRGIRIGAGTGKVSITMENFDTPLELFIR